VHASSQPTGSRETIPGAFLPAGESPRGTVFHCGLCGAAFTHEGRVCSACPLGASCDLVRCPGCGFTFPRGSRITDWARRFWSRLRFRSAE
jgi:hypothetical protein